MRFQYRGPMRQATWRPYGCMGCSPLVAGGILILVGLAFQTDWAGDAARFLLRVMGWVLVLVGGLTIISASLAWWTRRRRPL